MKLKVKSNRRGVKLKGETTGSEDLIYSEAECIKAGCDETLFALSYEKKKKGYEFEYYVGTARPIKEVLSSPLALEYFEPMLVSFLDLAKACDSNGLTYQRVCFDDEYIFFDPVRYSLRFAYMPVRGATERIFSPLHALEHLAQRVKLKDEDAQELAASVLDYVMRSAIFSWPEYETFLHEHGVLDRSESNPRDTSLLEERATTRIDCRDSYGFDFMDAPEEVPVDAHEPSTRMPAQQRTFTLVRMLDGMEWPLKHGINVIGSSAASDVQLEGIEGVSRRHAEILVSNDACQITDLNSTNGLKVNGIKLAPNKPVTLQEGDIIHIARMQLTVT